jgi:AraC family transcriptional regulator of adaptative response/methylated-DNA-[protein]-cysteine methyltransferase
MNPGSTGYLRYTGATAGELCIPDASYRSGSNRSRVIYTLIPWQFGLTLLASTRQGICWLGIHQDAAYLEAELRKDLRRAEIIRDDDAMQDAANQAIAFMNGTATSLDLPVDVSATPFQLAVWRELCAIPAGATSSYGDIARRLGRPLCARAVGRANASNPLAVLIPCHRVVASDNKLTGYRWGLEIKHSLLEYERSR